LIGIRGIFRKKKPHSSMTSTSNELIYAIRRAATELELKGVIEESLSLNREFDKVKFITLTIVSLRVHQTERLDSNDLENIAVAIVLLKWHRDNFFNGEVS
jgi:hypothetical protein